MASVGFGSSVAAVAPASSPCRGGRRRRSCRPRRGAAAAKEEKGLAEFIFGVIFKKDQLVETDPLLNKVDGAPSSGSTVSRKASGTAAGGGNGSGFNFGGLFAKKG